MITIPLRSNIVLKFIRSGTSILSLFFLSLLAAGLLPAVERTEKSLLSTDSLSVKHGFENTILFTARDSVRYNLESRTIELWGKAHLGRKDTRVEAPRIVVDIETSLLHAYGDSTKVPLDPAIFIDRQSSFTSRMMTYNLKTGVGETTNARSTSKGLYFSGKEVSKLENGRMKITDGTFTSCDLQDPQDSQESQDSEDHQNPHYWFSSSHITIVPDRVITATPLVMYLKPEILSFRLPAVPILALPYMVFPIKSDRSSGFLTPGLGNDNTRGYYLSNLGYFWAISDYADLRFEGNVATSGSWQLSDRFRFSKINSFTSELWGEYKHYTQSNEWNARVKHSQVIQPSVRLDVNLNFSGGERITDLNAVNSGSVVSQQTDTYASLAKTFNDENTIAVAGFKGSNDLLSHDNRGNIALEYYQNRLYPFRSAIAEGDNDWKSNLSITPASSFDGQFSSQAANENYTYSGNLGVEAGYDQEFADGYKAFFTQGLNMQISKPGKGFGNDALYDGARVVFPLRMQSTIFSHININPGLTYTRSLQTEGEESPFAAAVFSVDASTRLYGTVSTGFLENLIGLKALLHTVIPTITYTSNHPFSGSSSSRYGTLYDWIDPRFNGQFETSFNAGIPEGARMVTLTLKNLFDGRFRGSSSTDSANFSAVDHTDQLLSLTAKSAYNFAAEDRPLQPFVVTTSSSALSPGFLLTTGSMYDFYSYDSNGEPLNRFLYDDGKGLLRFVKGFVNMSFSVEGSREGDSSPSTYGAPVWSDREQSLFADRFKMSGFNTVDYTVPWQLQLALFLNSEKINPLKPAVNRTLVNGTARVNLLKNWQFGFTSGYDFQNNKVVFPLLQAYRNLHCWQVGLQWVPFGEFKSYSIQIGLKAPELKAVKFRQTSSSADY